MQQRSAVPMEGVGIPGDPETAPLGTPQLTFLQPISRQLVHRAAVAEVFVTDGVRESDGGFVVAAQWPRDHALYHPDDNGLADPMLFAETIRQALLYVGHVHFGIPLGHRFVGRDLDFEIYDPELLRVGGTPLPVLLDVRWAWEDNRPPRRYGMRLEVKLTVGGRVCGRGSIAAFVVDDRSYSLLRNLTRKTGEGHPPDGAAPARPPLRRRTGPAPSVGRLRTKDCVLEPGERPGEWLLRADPNHAILFDHPTDHLPLMVILEGFRQLGYLRLHENGSPSDGGRSYALAGAVVDCAAFAELDEPVRLVTEMYEPGADPDDPVRMRIAAVQGGSAVATATLTWVCAQTGAAPVGGSRVLLCGTAD